MRVIDHRQFGQKRAKRRWAPSRRLWWAAAAVVGLFVVANAGMWLAYRHRVLPNYSLSGVGVGNVSFGGVAARVQGKILPPTLTLRKDGLTQQLVPSAVGVNVDTAASIADLQRARPVLPVLSLVMHHDVPARITLRSQVFEASIPALSAAFGKASQPPHIIFSGQQFAVAPAATGYRLDAVELEQDVLKALRQGQRTVTVPTVSALPATPTIDANAERAHLQKQLGAQLGFIYNGKTVHPNVAEIGSWYVPAGETMTPAPSRIASYIDGIAKAAANRSDLSLATQYALGKSQSLNFAVVPAGSVKRTYCTATRGVSDAAISDMIGKLAATYADARGWNNDGRIAFEHVAGDCEYTVWLSASSQMTSFGAICDNYYNCQVGTNVIVNDDRWNYATDPWNATGRGLEEYRTLIIDHETGHRLGFYDNPTCPGAGLPAPVMMQQSIGLKGCVFNVWPVAAELQTLAANLGLPSAQSTSD